jgi:WD40 repeat protein
MVLRVGHSISALKFDECYLVAGSFSAVVSVWDVFSGSRRCQLIGHTEAVFCVDFSAPLDLIFSGSANSTIAVWSLSTGQLLKIVATSCIPHSVHCSQVALRVGSLLTDGLQLMTVIGVDNTEFILFSFI